MDLKYVETFQKIASLKSFTKAADELFLTQPTISKQLSELEKSLGVRLLDRTKRSVTLTKAGEILLKYAKDLKRMKKDILDELSAFQGLEKGAITIGASNIPGVYILPKIMSSFKKRYSSINIRLIISDSKEIIARMEEGEYDIGFVGTKGETKKLEYRKFNDDQIVVIAPIDYPDTIKIGQLFNYPLLSREPGSGTRNHFEKAIKSIQISRERSAEIVAEIGNTESIKNAVKSGIGISYISYIAVKDDIKQGKIKLLNINGMPDITRSFYIVTRKGRTISPHVKAFIDISERWDI